jgi:hypothetical protein
MAVWQCLRCISYTAGDMWAVNRVTDTAVLDRQHFAISTLHTPNYFIRHFALARKLRDFCGPIFVWNKTIVLGPKLVTKMYTSYTESPCIWLYIFIYRMIIYVFMFIIVTDVFIFQSAILLCSSTLLLIIWVFLILNFLHTFNFRSFIIPRYSRHPSNICFSHLLLAIQRLCSYHISCLFFTI